MFHCAQQVCLLPPEKQETKTKMAVSVLKIYLFLFHTYEGLPACVYMLACKPGAYGGQERAMDSLELELHVIVSHCVGAGN